VSLCEVLLRLFFVSFVFFVVIDFPFSTTKEAKNRNVIVSDGSDWDLKRVRHQLPNVNLQPLMDANQRECFCLLASIGVHSRFKMTVGIIGD